MELNILHITDLHIGAKDNPDDFLREGFYRDYIDKLHKQISLNVKIDYLIISGDYINAIAVDTPIEHRFEHASKIVTYIQEVFSIPKAKTFSCIGNHDIIIEEESKGELVKARKDFYNFIPNITSSYIDSFENFAFIYKDEDNYILSLDSTLKSNGEIKPGNIEVKEVDGCINLIRKYVPKNCSLIIIMHYPFFEVTGTISAIEEPGWEEKHIWKSAFVLRKRIEDLRDKNLYNTCAIFGDIHLLHHNQHEGILYFSSGRFGTNIFKPEISNPKSLTMQPRQARVYSLGKTEANCITASWNPISHKENPHLGEWEINNVAITLKSNPTSVKEVLGESKLPTARLQTFSEITESKIIKEITNLKMYRFGRFNTAHENYVSLAWILVNKLLNNHILLCDIIEDMKNWISSKSFVPKDTILFGLDCWGNVVSSQLSAYTNIVNYCTISRAEGKHGSPDELLCEKIKSDLKRYSNIIIVTDVVATGNGTDFIYQSIKSYCSDYASFYIFSIIADEVQNHFLEKSYTHITSCSKLRIPIIEKDKLPSEEILPPIVAFK